MTEIRNLNGEVITSGEGTVAEVARANKSNLRYANLQGANLRDAYLRYANLQGANLQDANLRYANLQGADLRYANLQGADLRDANLRDAYLRYAYLRDANLQGAYLRYANLRDANLQDANLRYANLQGADLRYANLQGADLRDANLQGIPAPLVLLAQWGPLPDPLTLDLMRYDAANHPKPERFLAWANGGPCPYSLLALARAAGFQQRRELIGPDFLALPVKSALALVMELAEFKGFKFI